MAYDDEVADIARGYTSTVEHPDEDEDQGVSTLAQAGSPLPDANPATPFGTGRFSENGNELPPGLYSGARSPSAARSPDTDLLNNVPDSQYAAATGQPAGVPDGAGGAAGGTPTPATSTVAPAAPDYAAAGFAGELRNLQQGDRTARMMEAQPSEAATIAPLQSTLAAASVPVDKRAKEYRPSVGQRILRGVQGYMRGGVPGAVDPAAVGGKPYGAGNGDYDAEVARRAAVVTNTAQRIAQAQAAYKERQAQLKQQGETEEAQSLGYSRLPTGVAGQQNAASAAANAKANQQRADQEDPVKKAAATAVAQAAEFQRIQSQNDDPKSLFNKLPLWAKIYRLGNNGKVPEGIKGREGTAEESMYQRVASAWSRDPANKGKQPTASDIANMVAQSKGQPTPEARLTEQQTRDQIRATTTGFSTASRKLIAAQKALATTFDPKQRPNAQKAVDDAQREYDDAETKLQSFSQGGNAAENTPGGGAPVVPKVVTQANPPPVSTLQGLKPGQGRKFKNGQVWTLENGKPKRVS